MKRIAFVAGLAIAVTTIAARAEVRPSVVSCKLIKTPAQLAAIGANATTLAGSYCLANDIDLSAIPSWTPIGSTDVGAAPTSPASSTATAMSSET